jgi:hypothetical protein
MTVKSALSYLKPNPKLGELYARVSTLDDTVEIELDMSIPLQPPAGYEWVGDVSSNKGALPELALVANSASHTVVFMPCYQRIESLSEEGEGDSFQRIGCSIAAIEGAGNSVIYTSILQTSNFRSNSITKLCGLGCVNNIFYIPYIQFSGPSEMVFGFYKSFDGASWQKTSTTFPDALNDVSFSPNFISYEPILVDGNENFIAIFALTTRSVSVSRNGGSTWETSTFAETMFDISNFQWYYELGQQPFLCATAIKYDLNAPEANIMQGATLLGAPVVSWNGDLVTPIWKKTEVPFDASQNKLNFHYLANGLRESPRPPRPNYYEDYVVIRNRIVLGEYSRDDGTGKQTRILLNDFNLWGVDRPISSLMQHVNYGYMESFAVVDIEVDGVLLGVGPGQSTRRTLSYEGNSIRVLLRPLTSLDSSIPLPAPLPPSPPSWSDEPVREVLNFDEVMADFRPYFDASLGHTGIVGQSYFRTARNRMCRVLTPIVDDSNAGNYTTWHYLVRYDLPTSLYELYHDRFRNICIYVNQDGSPYAP